MTENPNTPPEPEAQPDAQADADAGRTPGGGSGPAAEASQAATPSEPAQPSEPSAAAEAGQPPTSQTPDQTAAWAAAPDGEPLDDYGEPLDPNAPNTSVAATFLPGIEAGSVLALLLALLAAGAYLLIYPLVLAHGAARTWSDFKNNTPRAKQDPFGTERDWVEFQSWTHIILGLAAILVALLILGLWTAQKNKLWSRAFAQAALVLGLAVVLYGILLKTGVVGSEIPSMKEIGKALNSQP